MKKLLKTVFVLNLLFLSFQCLMDTAPGTGVGSCMITTQNVCYDYTGSIYTSSDGESACVQNNGTYSAGACPASDSSGPCTGSCVVYSGLSTQMTVRIYEGYPAGPTFCATMSGTYSSTCQ